MRARNEAWRRDLDPEGRFLLPLSTTVSLAPRAPPRPRPPRLVRRKEGPAGPARHARTSPSSGSPTAATLWHAGPGPLSLDELWRAYLARFDVEHAFKLLKGTFGLTAAKVRTPGRAGRWVRLLMAAHAQLLLARPLAGGLRRPWEKQPDPARPGPAGVSQHLPPAGDTRPCRETLPPRARQAQKQQQRPSTPLPSPRRSRHAAHSESSTDQGKG
jgi:hypothetical protein